MKKAADQKKSKRPAVQVKISKRNLRCELNDAELLASGKELAERTSDLKVMEEDAKRSAADFKARITALQSQISVLSNRVNTGYEFRIVDCKERFDTPRVGKKRVIRTDTGALIGIEEMTASEMQRELPIAILPAPTAVAHAEPTKGEPSQTKE